MRIRAVRTPYRITQRYGYDKNYPLNNGFHYGTDYVSEDKIIVSPMDSRVSSIGYDKTNGNYLVLVSGVHRDWFSHIKTDSYKVKVGQTVRVGQELAIMGNTGYSTGVHLHHSLRVNTKLVDPEEHITKMERTKVTLTTARILAFHILFRNGVATSGNALNGDYDADLKKNHVGHDLEEKIIQMYTSGERKVNLTKMNELIKPSTYRKVTELYEKVS